MPPIACPEDSAQVKGVGSGARYFEMLVRLQAKPVDSTILKTLQKVALRERVSAFKVDLREANRALELHVRMMKCVNADVDQDFFARERVAGGGDASWVGPGRTARAAASLR